MKTSTSRTLAARPFCCSVSMSSVLLKCSKENDKTNGACGDDAKMTRTVKRRKLLWQTTDRDNNDINDLSSSNITGTKSCSQDGCECHGMRARDAHRTYLCISANRSYAERAPPRLVLYFWAFVGIQCLLAYSYVSFSKAMGVQSRLQIPRHHPIQRKKNE